MPVVINHQKQHMTCICHDTPPLREELTVSMAVKSEGPCTCTYGPPHCRKVGGLMTLGPPRVLGP